MIALVKPQFEAGRDQVGAGGLVTDPAVHARVIDEVAAAAHQIGLTRLGLEASPITGAEGNREFLMLLRRQTAAKPPIGIALMAITRFGHRARRRCPPRLPRMRRGGRVARRARL